MDLGSIALGALGVFFGLRTVARGVETLGNGLTGQPRVERDPGVRGAAGRKVGVIDRGPKGGRVELRSVGSLTERINAIRDRVRRGKVDPRVIAWARKQVTKKCPGRGHGAGQWCIPEKDTVQEVVAIYQGMRRDVKYVSDPVSVDMYVSPRRTLEHRAGDCDDMSALACASLQAIGISCRLKVIRTRESQTWNHVYAMAASTKDGTGKWIAFDASVPARAGWEVPASQIAEARIFEVG